MKFTSLWAGFWRAEEEAGVRISVDAVRGICPSPVIRRKVNGTAVAARLGAGARHQGGVCV